MQPLAIREDSRERPRNTREDTRKGGKDRGAGKDLAVRVVAAKDTRRNRANHFGNAPVFLAPLFSRNRPIEHALAFRLIRRGETAHLKNRFETALTTKNRRNRSRKCEKFETNEIRLFLQVFIFLGFLRTRFTGGPY